MIECKDCFFTINHDDDLIASLNPISPCASIYVLIAVLHFSAGNLHKLV